MKRNLIQPLASYENYLGAWLWAMQDTRRRTLDSIKGLDDETTNWIPLDGTNSIGTLLYHLAAIEVSWLYEDILGGMAFPPEIVTLMIYDVRDDDGNLTPINGESLDSHLNRLMICRQILLSTFEGMSLEEFKRPRVMENYEVTPEWVIHHLIQHEAEHRGQIGEIRKMAERAFGSG